MSWLSGWSYKKTVSITGQTGAGNDYQVDFSIGDAAGGDFHLENHCSSFPNDIQVTDNDQTTPLDYWVKDLTVDPITMWVEVSDNLGSNVDVCIYYGKSGESSASDGENTFEFFDDFEGDLSKWTIVAGAPTISGGELVLHTTDSIRTDNAYDKSRLTFINAQSDNSPNAYLFVQVSDTFTWAYSGDRAMYNVQTKFYTVSVNNGVETQADRGNSDDNYHDYEIIPNIAGESWFWRDGTKYVHTTNIPNTANLYPSFVKYSLGVDSYINLIYVRKYASPEPAFSSAGSEESAPVGAIMNQFQKANLGADLYNGALIGALVV